MYCLSIRNCQSAPSNTVETAVGPAHRSAQSTSNAANYELLRQIRPVSVLSLLRLSTKLCSDKSAGRGLVRVGAKTSNLQPTFKGGNIVSKVSYIPKDYN